MTRAEMHDLVKAIMAEVDHAQKPIVNRIRLLAGRGTLHLVNDGPAVQTVQATFLKDETRDGMERVQDYGFTSVPLAGMQPIAVFFGGDRSNGVVIACADRRYRLKGLQSGEVALYDDLGQKVHLTRSGVVVETPLDATVKAGQTLRLDARDMQFHASQSMSWDVHGNGKRLHWRDGQWQWETWQQGAVYQPEIIHSVSPPEGPPAAVEGGL